MKVIYDARLISLPFSGLGRYTYSILNALLKSYSNPDLELEILLWSGMDRAKNPFLKSLEQYEQSGRCKLQYLKARPISLTQHLFISRYVNKSGGDLYFYPHFDMPIGVKLPSIFVIHDLIPLKVGNYIEELSFLKRFYFSTMIKIGLRHASKCIAVSRTTRDDILNFVGDRYLHKLLVVYEGSFLEGFRCEFQSAENELNFFGNFLLYVGDRRPHKNIQRILDVFIALRDIHGYQGYLVLAGSLSNYGFDLENYVSSRSDVIVLGSVSDPRLANLYRHCDSLIFLSKYEGFGLPVIESAFFNKKMLLSDGGSLKEIAPPCAFFLNNSLSVREAAKAAYTYLNDPLDIEYSSFCKKFDWDIAAQAIFPGAYI